MSYKAGRHLGVTLDIRWKVLLAGLGYCHTQTRAEDEAVQRLCLG